MATSIKIALTISLLLILASLQTGKYGNFNSCSNSASMIGLPSYFPVDWRLAKFEELSSLKIWKPSF